LLTICKESTLANLPENNWHPSHCVCIHQQKCPPACSVSRGCIRPPCMLHRNQLKGSCNDSADGATHVYGMPCRTRLSRWEPEQDSSLVSWLPWNSSWFQSGLLSIISRVCVQFLSSKFHKANPFWTRSLLCPAFAAKLHRRPPAATGRWITIYFSRPPNDQILAAQFGGCQGRAAWDTQSAEHYQSQCLINHAITTGAKVFLDEMDWPVTYADINPTRWKLIHPEVGAHWIVWICENAIDLDLTNNITTFDEVNISLLPAHRMEDSSVPCWQPPPILQTRHPSTSNLIEFNANHQPRS